MGQMAMQSPHSEHGAMNRPWSRSSSARSGQTGTHSPQATHSAGSTRIIRRGETGSAKRLRQAVAGEQILVVNTVLIYARRFRISRDQVGKSEPFIYAPASHAT